MVVFEEYDFGEYLYERDHWIVFLAPNQSNLGTCVVALKRNEKFLGNLRKDEWEEMLRIISEIENAVKKEFGATMFNWGVLLNSFYRQNTPPPHLHWHFIPRYREEVTVNGETFDDPFFGYMRPRPPKRISRETFLEIGRRILRWIKV
ncbi:HIT family protein [Methanothermobacter thermautotrophicus]|uniref:HIT family protein n=1 Tax=Methanothermobacter thermautotrophicus TaxID=145262 RepID=UPI00064E5538|nr:HIT family protein [Methanothermobacter thermautotrophicus]WBF06286.1 HIT family protein [Methanothermobacter thermautotrophicus]